MRFKLTTFRLAALLAAPMLASSAAVTLTVGASTTCEYGPCSSVDSLTAGQTASGAPDVTFTVNGDSYQLYSPFSVTNKDPHGTSINFTPTVTYTSTTPSAQADVFTIDFLQNFVYTGALNGFYYSEAANVATNNAASASTVNIEAFYGGQGLGLMTFGPGDASGSDFAQLFGLSGNPLTFDYKFTFDFAAGSVAGSSISSPASVPEPTTYAFALLGGMALMSAKRFRRQRKPV